MERPEPTAPFLARVERVLLWLLLPAFVACLVLTLRLSAKVDTLEQALAEAPAATPAAQASAGGGKGTDRIGGRLQISGPEREQVLRTRLEAYIEGAGLGEEEAASLRASTEELIEEAARLRQARQTGEMDNRKSREQLQQARDAMILSTQEYLGEEAGESLRDVLFPPAVSPQPVSD